MSRTLFSQIKKLIVHGILWSILFTSTIAPRASFAQSANQTNNQAELPQQQEQASAALFPTGSGESSSVDFGIEDEQAAAFQAGQQDQGQSGVEGIITDLVDSGLACSASQILGQLLTTAISSAITSIIKGIVGTVIETLLTPTVPINTKYDEAGQHIVGDVRARSGSFTLFGIMINVGWDAIAWCIVNAMIEHIANATIEWANSGFNGNPAFLQNPERFFRDLADYQAGTIIRDIAYGASGGKVNICQPFRVNIAIGLAESYKGSGQNAIDSRYRGMSCSLSDIQQQKLFGGVNVTTGSRGVGSQVQGSAITWSDWLAVSQTDANNPYGAYILANEALYAAVDAKQNELKFEIGLNNGWLNFKKCKDGETDTTKCDTVTPGRLIESQLNQTLGLSKQRLVMADKFDQMITAIVNNLIKIALNEVLGEGSN
jgi:hypothetical protein